MYFDSKQSHMILTEENYRQKINSLSKKDWAPLLELIPIIENTQGFGKLMNVNKDEDGTLHMPYWKAAPFHSSKTQLIKSQ